MKLLALFVFIVQFNLTAQTLYYNDLETILSKTIVESNDYLEDDGYRIFKRDSNGAENQISYIWDKNGKNDPTVSYLIITWDKIKDYTMVFYQFHSQSHFNILKNSLEKAGYKLSDSLVKFERILYEYKSKNHIVSMSKGEKDYTFTIRYNL